MEQEQQEKQQLSGKNILEQIKDFQVSEVLNINNEKKFVYFLGNLPSDKENKAILILYKKGFPISVEEEATNIKIPQVQSFDQYHENDIYSRFTTLFNEEYNKIDLQIIYPATQKQINKYRRAVVEIFEETPELYEKVTEPYIKEDASKSLQWVYNILEGKQEQDKIIYKDEDSQNGFLLVPDYKWSDFSKTENLHVIALINRRDLHSIRSLAKNELQLLQNIYNKGTQTIKEKYNVTPSNLRIFFHYQPTFYHLHIHFMNSGIINDSMLPERAHLLQNVIQNIQMVPNYYQIVNIQMCLTESTELFKRIKNYQKQQQKQK